MYVMLCWVLRSSLANLLCAKLAEISAGSGLGTCHERDMCMGEKVTYFASCFQGCKPVFITSVLCVLDARLEDGSSRDCAQD